MSAIYQKFSSAFQDFDESCDWRVRFDEAGLESAVAEVEAGDESYFSELKIKSLT